MKSSSINRFFLCFRPIDIDSDDIEVDCSPHMLGYMNISVSKKNSNLMKSDSVDQMKSSGRRSFPEAVKTVLYETSLVKKVRDRRERKRLRRSNSNLSDHQSIQPKLKQKSSKSCSWKPLQNFSNYNYFPGTLPPPNTPASDESAQEIKSLPPSPENNTTKYWAGEKRKELWKAAAQASTMTNVFGSLKLNHVLFLVIVSLWMTIFWGRLAAVMMTTVWIYSVQLCKNVAVKKDGKSDCHHGDDEKHNDANNRGGGGSAAAAARSDGDVGKYLNKRDQRIKKKALVVLRGKRKIQCKELRKI